MSSINEKSHFLLFKISNSASFIISENEINNYRNQLKIHNVEDINNKKYQYQDGVYYMDIIGEAEKLGDYVLNVVQAVIEKKI